MRMSSVLELAVLGWVIWMFVIAHRDERERTAQREAQVQRFVDMLARIRAYLSVWSVRPRA